MLPYFLKPYRPNVGIMLLNDKGQALICKRTNTVGLKWQMPQGGIEQNEDIQTAAKRELLEETGIQNVEIITITKKQYKYDFPKHIRSNKTEKYRGQKQTWVLMRYLGSDIHADFKNKTDMEFEAIDWCNLNDVISNVIEFKRPVYKRVIEYYTRSIKKC